MSERCVRTSAEEEAHQLLGLKPGVHPVARLLAEALAEGVAVEMVRLDLRAPRLLRAPRWEIVIAPLLRLLATATAGRAAIVEAPTGAHVLQQAHGCRARCGAWSRSFHFSLQRTFPATLLAQLKSQAASPRHRRRFSRGRGLLLWMLVRCFRLPPTGGCLLGAARAGACEPLPA